MNMKFALYGVAALLAGMLAADETAEISACRTFSAAAAAGQTVYSNTFDQASSVPAKLPPGYAWSARDGRNGTGALFYERTDPAKYRMLEFSLPKLSEANTYTVEVFVRGEDIKFHGDEKLLGGICIEYFKNGKWHSGYYHQLKTVGNEWRKITLPVTTKPGTNMVIKLYMRKQITGRLWFDDLVFRTAGSAASIVLNKPKMLNLGADGKFTLSTANAMDEKLRLLVDTENNGQKYSMLLSGKKHIYTGAIPKLAPGTVKMSVAACDMTKKQTVFRENFTLTHSGASRSGGNAATLDEAHRLLIGGKPFMPIGIYGLPGDKDLQIISQGGFNALIVYGSLQLNGGKKTADQLADIRAGLDRFSKYGLKCIFSLKDQYGHKKGAQREWQGEKCSPDAVAAKVVAAFKDHPAILCWYINDEEQRDNVPAVAGLRAKISAIDPHHPVLSLTYRSGDFPYYGISGDIMGVDPYVINASKEQSLQQIEDILQNAAETRQAVWMVPQSFNWGVYQTADPAKFAAGRFPTAGEMRAMAMLGALNGCKGFIFYSYFDMKNRAEKLMPGSFKKEWPKLLSAVRTLKSMEPFIMSRHAITPLPVKTAGKGALKAACFTADNGKKAVAILNIDEKAAGEITLPPGKFRPGAGAVGKIVNGKYIFQPRGIECDTLFEE